MKCDETRPTCLKCAQKGWVCGGYSSGVKWSYKHQHTFVGFQPSPGRGPKSVTEEDHTEREPSQAPSDAPSSSVDQQPFTFDNIFSPGNLPAPINTANHGQNNDIANNECFQSVVADDSVQLSWPVDDDSVSAVDSTMEPTAFSSQQSDTSSAMVTMDHNFAVDSNAFDMFMMQIPPMPSPSSGPETTLRLINNWFDSVCPAWSGFDSRINMNRQLASSLWQSSASVFHSLQSMSASFMSARTPQLKRPARRLLQTAASTIQAEVDSIKLTGPTLNYMPTSLLFSLFCLGTTICWLDPGLVGAPFLEEARSLLQRAVDQFQAADSETLALISFFKKSLVYWEMLVSVVDDTSPRSQADIALLSQRLDPVDVDPFDGPGTDMVLHPWTGISSTTSRLFARSIRLCRTYRRRITNPTGRAISLSTAMQEIEEAQKLEERLLELDFSSVIQFKADTGDPRTPWPHLARVAEAYQLAALLQLYVTFPDLVSIRLPHESALSGEGDVPWDKWITPLALRLVSVLEQIPPDSSSRVMQPLLYICACTGLRHSSSSPPKNLSTRSETASRPTEMRRTSHSAISGRNFVEYVGQIDAGDDTYNDDPDSIPQVAMDIANARHFIMFRLSVLSSTLQPRPIVVAQNLVKAIWAAYDSELGTGSTSVHWLDVMKKGDLISLFG